MKFFVILFLLFTTSVEAREQVGKASWYSTKIGTRTASGERLNDNAYTAAHRSLPFGTRVNVINLRNQRSITVRITDRGPFIKGRIIDVTRAAAHALGMIRSGIVPVRILF